MFTALVRLGREQAAQGRRSQQECERWERAVQQLAMPTTVGKEPQIAQIKKMEC